MPEIQALEVCKKHRAGPGSQGQEVCRIRGSEDRAIKSLNFTAFLTQRSNIPHKTRSALSLVFLIFPSAGECFPAVVETTVGGNAVPEPSDLTCV